MKPKLFFCLQKQTHLFILRNITVLSVDVITVLSVSLSHQQDAETPQGTEWLAL
ncbi:hypothetical protein SNO32_000740 [Cronobacter sakazakii]|uniref:hypothetical protein n=1 Tax=Cronobacter sakazakii TaxID=28141 RepID=UPI001AEB134C|nr:hypothetical protein [Cronobacter sakazakii]ELY2714523.1 hypothetical protein [Cronobacter sakazakii]ELY4706872.1 hypothetical protein [Cronobacter sakazakii]ELY6089840.1 hypothetical protein [Cronobacter sakazakii]